MRIVLTASLVLLGSLVRQEAPPPSAGGSGEQTPSREDLEAEAAEAVDREDWAAAVLAHERLVEASPKSQKAWLGLGIAKMRLGDLEGALLAFQQATSKGGDLGAFARHGQALVKARQGDPDAAIRELSQAFEDASSDMRLSIVRVTRDDPECEPLRSLPNLAKLQGSVLDPTVASPLREGVFRFLQASGQSPSDVGLLADGRVVLFLDRSDYRKPGAPFVVEGVGEAILGKARPSSLAEAREFCQTSLARIDPSPELWAKARLYSQLFGYPVGVVERQKLFVYFYEPEGATVIEPQVVAIIDLLLKQQAGDAALTLENLRLSKADLLDALQRSACSLGEVRAQFDIVFGFDPFVQLVNTASRALHAKKLIQDPRRHVPEKGSAFDYPSFVNPCFRVRGNPLPGVVTLTWPPRESSPEYMTVIGQGPAMMTFAITREGLGTLEVAARRILAQMRDTEDVFVPLFRGLRVSGKSRPVPDRSPELWSFLEARDWSWWNQPRLMSLAKEGTIQPALKFLSNAQGHETMTQDFGGAWASYFDTLNASFRSQMAEAIEKLVVGPGPEQGTAANSSDPTSDEASRPASVKETFTIQGHDVTIEYMKRMASANRRPAVGSRTIIAYEIEVRARDQQEFKRIVDRKQVPYSVSAIADVLQETVLRMRNGDSVHVIARGALFPDLKRWNLTDGDTVRMRVDLLSIDGRAPEATSSGAGGR